jgi:predicted CXXCH cytochrome family protein
MGNGTRSISVILATMLGVFALTALAIAGSAPGTGIKGTYHDLSTLGAGSGYGDSIEQSGKNRICVYCHAPHHTLKVSDAANAHGVTYLPLWNHGVSAITNYTTYTAGSQDFPLPSLVDQGVGQPGNVSRLCLSCHDGTIATNQYGFYATTSFGQANKFISGRAQIGLGSDLSNHHPIGFNYYAAAAVDNEIAPATYPLVAAAGATGTNIVFLKIQDVLYNGQMECATCHDVHNTRNQGNKFTWVDDTQSAFCFTCHLKDITAGQAGGTYGTMVNKASNTTPNTSVNGLHGQ